jgi:CheY-like chemotaxis protein
MRPTGRILVVDDDPLFLDTYRHLLASEGHYAIGSKFAIG